MAVPIYWFRIDQSVYYWPPYTYITPYLNGLKIQLCWQHCTTIQSESRETISYPLHPYMPYLIWFVYWFNSCYLLLLHCRLSNGYFLGFSPWSFPILILFVSFTRILSALFCCCIHSQLGFGHILYGLSVILYYNAAVWVWIDLLLPKVIFQLFN